MEKQNLAGRVAFITGGGKGIGLQVASRLASEGASIVVSDRSGNSAKDAARQLSEEHKVDVLGITGDISREDDAAAMLGDVDRKFGRLDILVNNAGISLRVGGRKSPVEHTPLEVWQQTLDVNLTGTFLVTRAAIPLLKRSDQGRIVNIGSMAGRTSSEFTACYYAASKAGLIGFARVLAREVAPFGITVNTIAPTRIDTDMARTFSNLEAVENAYVRAIPLGRIGRPADVAHCVAYLASAEAGFMTGAILDLTGGQFMA
jgi:3-oxoacyl-[acyl-carrier protein] reductase